VVEDSAFQNLLKRQFPDASLLTHVADIFMFCFAFICLPGKLYTHFLCLLAKLPFAAGVFLSFLSATYPRLIVFIWSLINFWFVQI
jgi:hypothetical protein